MADTTKKAAIVVGASGGIGHAMALRLAQDGFAITAHYAGTGSEIHDVAPDLSKGLTTPEEAKQSVDATGVDILAPAVGNMHGMPESMVQGKTKKRLDITRVTQIKSATGILITLHGGSGTDDEDFRKAIAAGIDVIHINTELGVAWRRGQEVGLAKKPREVVPYKILPAAVEAVKQVATSRLKLFNKLT